MELGLKSLSATLDKFPDLQRISLFGGDIFDDLVYTRDLFSELSARKLKIRTFIGGGNISHRAIDALQQFPGVECKLSLEPPEWENRKIGGKSTWSQLNPEILRRIAQPYDVCCTVPVKPVPVVKLRQFICRLIALLGGSNFKLKVCLEYPAAEIPIQYLRWVEEDPQVTLSQVFASMREASNLAKSACNLTSSVSLAPDGEVYACLNHCINMDKVFVFGGEGHRDMVLRQSKVMGSATCAACSAKYLCRNFCMLETPGEPANCKLLRLAASRAPRGLVNDRLGPLAALVDPAALEETYGVWLRAQNLTDAAKVLSHYKWLIQS